jgi:hypothetical protein
MLSPIKISSYYNLITIGLVTIVKKNYKKEINERCYLTEHRISCYFLNDSPLTLPLSLVGRGWGEGNNERKGA